MRRKISEEEQESCEIGGKLMTDYYFLTGSPDYSAIPRNRGGIEDGKYDMLVVAPDFDNYTQDMEMKNITTSSIVNPYGVDRDGLSYEEYIRFSPVPDKMPGEVTDEDIEHDQNVIRNSPVKHFKEGEWDKDRYVVLNMWNPFEVFEHSKVPKMWKGKYPLLVLDKKKHTLYFFQFLDETNFYKYMWWFCRGKNTKGSKFCYQLKALFDLHKAVKIVYDPETLKITDIVKYVNDRQFSILNKKFVNLE